MTLSVCLIVKDEAEVISRCLSCVKKFADEIIIADTGSTDGTPEIAAQFTNNIYSFEWCEDFSAARNFALEKATCDYIMWLDADDVITEENCKIIRGLVSGKPDFDVAFLKYASAFDEDGNPTFVYYRERIFRRSLNFRFEGAVHEAVVPRGKTIYSEAVILHKKQKRGEPLRNLRIFQKLIAEGKELCPREKFYYGRELLFNGMYLESAAVLENYLNGEGWCVNKAEACLNLYAVYSALGETQKALMSVVRAFIFAPPTGEACCILGAHSFNAGEYNTAIYWYKTALKCPNEISDGGFVNTDYCGFIPNIQLCVLYDKLGKFIEANEYNEAAGAIKPNNECYLKNKEYFHKKLKEVKV